MLHGLHHVAQRLTFPLQFNGNSLDRARRRTTRIRRRIQRQRTSVPVAVPKEQRAMMGALVPGIKYPSSSICPSRSGVLLDHTQRTVNTSMQSAAPPPGMIREVLAIGAFYPGAVEAVIRLQAPAR